MHDRSLVRITNQQTSFTANCFYQHSEKKFTFAWCMGYNHQFARKKKKISKYAYVTSFEVNFACE